MKAFERINLMTTITRRGYRSKIIEGLREIGVTYNMATVGENMGGLSVSDYLGLQENEIDAIFSVVSDSKADTALAFIEYCDYLDTIESSRAVATFTPIEGVSGPLVLEYISGPIMQKSITGGKTMSEPNEAKYSMVVTIVSKGYADIVVAAAKSAGARGGTMLYASGSGIHETEKFLNIMIEPEKEIVLTLAKSEIVKNVVSEITEKAGLAKPGAGITFVLPVTRTAGIVTDTSDKTALTADAESQTHDEKEEQNA